MALVTGNLKDLLGRNYASRQGEIHFIPSGPGIRYTGNPGQIMPTSEGAATIEPNGDFSADLADTSTFLNDMWYTIRIRWQDVGAGAALADFPDWQVRVTGPGSIVDMISFGPAYGGGGGGSIPNRKVWWVGLSAPPNRSFLWLHTNPDNTDDPANTGDVREWR